MTSSWSGTHCRHTARGMERKAASRSSGGNRLSRAIRFPQEKLVQVGLRVLHISLPYAVYAPALYMDYLSNLTGPCSIEASHLHKLSYV